MKSDSTKKCILENELALMQFILHCVQKNKKKLELEEQSGELKNIEKLFDDDASSWKK